MENKQLNLSEPENIMGTMDVNPLLIKLSIPMMISMHSPPVKYSISKIFCKSLQRFAAECCFICVRTFSFNAFLLFCCAFPGAASFLLKALDF